MAVSRKPQKNRRRKNISVTDFSQTQKHITIYL